MRFKISWLKPVSPKWVNDDECHHPFTDTSVPDNFSDDLQTDVKEERVNSKKTRKSKEAV